MYFDKNINTNLRALASSKGTIQFWILAAKLKMYIHLIIAQTIPKHTFSGIVKAISADLNHHIKIQYHLVQGSIPYQHKLIMRGEAIIINGKSTRRREVNDALAAIWSSNKNII